MHRKYTGIDGWFIHQFTPKTKARRRRRIQAVRLPPRDHEKEKDEKDARQSWNMIDDLLAAWKQKREAGVGDMLVVLVWGNVRVKNGDGVDAAWQGLDSPHLYKAIIIHSVPLQQQLDHGTRAVSDLE